MKHGYFLSCNEIWKLIQRSCLYAQGDPAGSHANADSAGWAEQQQEALRCRTSHEHNNRLELDEHLPSVFVCLALSPRVWVWCLGGVCMSVGVNVSVCVCVVIQWWTLNGAPSHGPGQCYVIWMLISVVFHRVVFAVCRDVCKVIYRGQVKLFSDFTHLWFG